MPKAATITRSMNAGEWSAWLEGRVDLAKYPASMRRASNFVITPQGPVMRRPGTAKQAPVYDETKKSYLIPFVFSNDQAMQVEFANLRMRFHDEDGLLARTPVAITAVLSAAGAPLQYTAAGHGALVGYQVVLAGFAFSTNLNGRVGTVTAVAGNDITIAAINTPLAIGSLAAATSATVYHVASTYTDTDVENLRYLSDTDTVYLFCTGHPVRKLQRFGAYDWRLTAVEFEDGPFAPINDTSTTLTPSAGSGNLVPTMTAAALPVPYTASASSEGVGYEAWRAFDNDAQTFWQSTVNQSGILEIDLGSAIVCDGYTIEMAKLNADTSYKSSDYAPGDFTFEGSTDNVTWTVLDGKVGYVLYDGGRSAYFKLKNAVAYRYYRLNVTRCTRNGAIAPAVARLLLTGPSATATTFTASAVTGINEGDVGFLASDVGRLIRFEGKDGFWRSYKILTRSSATVVTAQAQGDPISSMTPTTEWRLGMFSDTTGYPTCGCFFEDRLCMGGMTLYPDWAIASVTGKYEMLSQTEADGTVSDDNALVLKLNARKQGRIVWIATDGRALLLGTGSSEWAISSVDPNAALSARTAKARRASTRGSANLEPYTQDKQILFVQRANRTLREMTWVYEKDGYQAPSLSLFTSHFGTPRFVQLDFGAEPHALLFVRRGDGTVAVLTYNKEEDVVGWQLFDFNGFVESISVIPADDQTQDALWMVVRREIDGVTRRFVERLTRFWDFDSELLDAHFVDCGSTYEGTPITTVYGLYDYEGQLMCGLADGSPITPQVVVDGKLTFEDEASKYVLGIGFDADGETARTEAGAADGTAQAKIKRIHRMHMRLWETGGGKYAVRDADGDVGEYVEIDYLDPQTELDAPPRLFTGDTRGLDMPSTYGTDGTILFRATKEIPLPFNLIALMPSVVTQDQS